MAELTLPDYLRAGLDLVFVDDISFGLIVFDRSNGGLATADEHPNRQQES